MNLKYIGLLYGVRDEEICKLKHKNIRIEKKFYFSIELMKKYDSMKINKALLFRFDIHEGKNICYEIIYEENYNEEKTNEKIEKEIAEIHKKCDDVIRFINMYLGTSILLGPAKIYIDDKLNSNFLSSGENKYEITSLEKYMEVKIARDKKEYFLENFEELFDKMSDNEILKLIIEIYDSNLYTSNFRILFINFTTCLELLLVQGRSEITYKISRGIAVLLSSSKKEGKILYEKMKELYNMRSVLVHEGKYDDTKFIKKYNTDPMREIKQITNEAIRKLIELNLDKENLILLLNENGYGDL